MCIDVCIHSMYPHTSIHIVYTIRSYNMYEILNLINAL